MEAAPRLPAQDPLRPLLVRAARGDERAMAELYDLTSSQAYGWALRIAGDPSLAEEAVLDAYTQAWQDAWRHDPSRGTVAGWLLVIVRSRAMDARRAASRRERSAPDDTPEPPDPSADPEAEAQSSDRARRVRAAVAALPHEQRRVLEAAFFDGLSHSEAAEALGLPLGTVKTRVRAALASLRSQLAPALAEGLS